MTRKVGKTAAPKAKAATKKAQKPAETEQAPPQGERRLTGNAGKGRKPGVPNKATQTAKQAIALLADGMAPEVQGWLRQVANGVGTAWQEWEKPEDWDDSVDGRYPKGAKVLARGRLVLVPFANEGEPLHTVGLSDVADGTLPPGTIIDWLVKPDPDSAANTMLRALEYHIPKLGRIEHSDPDGKPLIPATIQIVGVKAPRRAE